MKTGISVVFIIKGNTEKFLAWPRKEGPITNKQLLPSEMDTVSQVQILDKAVCALFFC